MTQMRRPSRSLDSTPLRATRAPKCLPRSRADQRAARSRRRCRRVGLAPSRRYSSGDPRRSHTRRSRSPARSRPDATPSVPRSCTRWTTPRAGRDSGSPPRHAVNGVESHPGKMSAPIVIHHPSPAGGRQVTICGRIAGLAYDDHDVLEFLRRAGLPDAKQLLDRNGWSSEAGGRTRTWQRSGALVLERDARDLSLPHVLTRGPESSSLAGIGRGSPVLTGHGGWAAARGEVRTGRTGRCRGGSRPPGPRSAA